MLTVFSSCKLKTRQNERQGIKLPLETIAFYSDSFVARKINVEQKVAENWAPYCTDPHFDIKPNSAKKCIISFLSVANWSRQVKRFYRLHENRIKELNVFLNMLILNINTMLVKICLPLLTKLLNQ